MVQLRLPLLPVAGLLLLAATLAPAGAPTVLYNDGMHRVAGFLVAGETDDTRENFPPIGCTDALRPALVNVTIAPTSATDVVIGVVHFEPLDRPFLLTAQEPSVSFLGIAQDGCITPVEVTALVASLLVAYEITDEPPLF